jgi:hypothetical protein
VRAGERLCLCRMLAFEDSEISDRPTYKMPLNTQICLGHVIFTEQHCSNVEVCIAGIVHIWPKWEDAKRPTALLYITQHEFKDKTTSRISIQYTE